MINLSEFALRKLAPCSVDPITLAGLALGGLAGGAAGMMGGGGAQTPAAPTAPPTQQQAAPPQSAPTGSKPAPKPQQSTFLGAAAVPQGSASGSKTLLGQ